MLQTNPAEPSPSIEKLLTGKRWKHALFSTYALSLSYFESEILRPLLQGGCDDIWLIADAEGYRASLLERRSMRIGQEYRLIPVALPHGVFHAKCIYLGADDADDLLLVGSGNVTFGGHGRNTEVFEALGPQGAALAFDDFADFLEAAGTRPDIRMAQDEWITLFADRARAAAEAGSVDPASAPRLIHSLNRPVVEQLAPVLEPHGAVSRAIVMSPYHDPDGYAVRRLISAVRPTSTSVVVNDNDKNTSPFPFADSVHWDEAVTPVRRTEDDDRFVHAKWYELETSTHRLVLTGSINATRKALTTTDNVELGTMRVVPVTQQGIKTTTADLPALVVQKRLPSGLGERDIAYAHFDRTQTGVLHGVVITLRDVAGEWDGRLVHPDGLQVTFTAHLDEKGQFTSRDAGLEQLAEMTALQIRLVKGDREARGWVHNDMYLSMNRRRRLTAGAMSRLLRREGTDSDNEALLEYLALSAEKHARLFDNAFRSVPVDDGKGQEKTPLVRVDIGDLAPVENPDQAHGVSGIGTGHTEDQFERILLRFRRVLLGDGRRTTAELDGQNPTLVAEEDENNGDANDGSSEEIAKRVGLVRFEEAIGQLADDAATKPELVRPLLTMLFEVGMNMRLHRLRDRDLAYEFMQA